MNIEKSINKLYGGKLRVRVCGFCFSKGKLLLINQKNKNGSFWLPPGGGLEYGESVENAVKREFLEETLLNVQLEEFLFFTEFLEPPLHALELFHRVSLLSGTAKKGLDPEFSKEEQLINSIAWMTLPEIKSLDASLRHKVLQDDYLAKIGSLFLN